MPAITVPIITITITIAGDFGGTAADGKSRRNKFSAKHSHHILTGIGHNVPERPLKISPT
jgi:hypothetical protein